MASASRNENIWRDAPNAELYSIRRRSGEPDPLEEHEFPAWSRSLRLRLTLPFVLLVLVVMTALGVYLTVTARALYEDRLADHLGDQARLVALSAEPVVAAGRSGDLGPLADRLGATISARVSFVASDGSVLGDSAVGDPVLENLAEQPDVRDALARRAGDPARWSRIGGEDYLFVAVPIGDGVPPLAVARVAASSVEIDRGVARIRRGLVLVTGAAAVLAALVALMLAGRIARPLDDLRRQVLAVAAGKLDVTVRPADTREVGDLGRAFNGMTDELRMLVDEIGRGRRRLEVVLAALSDGVVITDDEGTVVRLNEAAAGLLRADVEEAVGRPFVVVSRDHELAALLRAALAGTPTHLTTVEHSLSRRTLEASAETVVGANERLGLVVLHDVTELRRLEAMRREFVANVSHELRTPLASIKALVETLEAGAMDDPAVAGDFLGRIVGEVDRLAALVDESLDLARLESGRVNLRLDNLDPLDLLQRGVARLAQQTERARLSLEIDVPADLPPVRADPARVEQVLLNLVHNAIKFTPAGGRIDVTAAVAGDWLRVGVRDTGVGVSPEELPRLFERFYKADKARRSDGTGLGLAIAKHIVHAHGGEIWAESEPGNGATFAFTLPLARPRAEIARGDSPRARVPLSVGPT